MRGQARTQVRAALRVAGSAERHLLGHGAGLDEVVEHGERDPVDVLGPDQPRPRLVVGEQHAAVRGEKARVMRDRRLAAGQPIEDRTGLARQRVRQQAGRQKRAIGRHGGGRLAVRGGEPERAVQQRGERLLVDVRRDVALEGGAVGEPIAGAARAMSASFGR